MVCREVVKGFDSSGDSRLDLSRDDDIFDEIFKYFVAEAFRHGWWSGFGLGICFGLVMAAIVWLVR